MKNEEHNLVPMLQSVKGCFDEIVIIDTGSTDRSIDVVNDINDKIIKQDPEWIGYPVIKLGHFKWVDDFSKARQFAMDMCTSDYMCWLDLDDSLSDAAAFIHWKKTVMHSAHYWLATYNYAFNDKGQVECQFIRERVVKLNYGFKWKYFVHEGLMKEDGQAYWPQRVSSWCVNHRRTEEDRKHDYRRNIDLIEKYAKHGELPSRMKFYHGKELIENGFHKEGCPPILEAIKSNDLEPHDRVLAIQYAAQSAIANGAWPQAVELLTNGLKLMVSRAEYWCLLGDVYFANNRMDDAMQCYKVALNSKPNDMGGIVVVYNYAYKDYPKIKLSEICIRTGQYDEARFWINILKVDNHPAVEKLEAELDKLVDLNMVRSGLPKCDDVVITCPPHSIITDWDEHSLAAKGHGGSETAAVEVARWIKKKTNRNVKIFAPREKREVMESGVEYIPSNELASYMQNVEPYAHIAWRHAVRLTKANSFVWCHDLQLPGGGASDNYDKVVALSEFHKNYLKEVSGVPYDKITIGFNGINPDDFPKEKLKRNDLKVVFSSSPDRGLMQAIEIVKRARIKSGLDIKLYCFYGTDNMRKMGQVAWAEKIEQAIKDNVFVIYKGMVPKKVLMEHFATASVWLYLNWYLETYCITAIEAMCAGAWPIVRPIAALPFTMKEAIEKDCCDLIMNEPNKPEDQEVWADALILALKEKKYQKMDFSLQKYSWENVADFFIREMSL